MMGGLRHHQRDPARGRPRRSVGAGLNDASKTFVGALTGNPARGLAPDRIRVNALSPGGIDRRYGMALARPLS